jgi:hypothetical protein
MKDSIDEIKLSEVTDLITKTLKSNTKRGDEYLEQGYSVYLTRHPVVPSFWDQNDEITIITQNSDMRLGNSNYCFKIGKLSDRDYPLQELVKFTITQLQSCCACAVFSYAFVDERLRDAGIGALVHRWRLYLSEKYGGYSMALCSAVVGKSWYEDDRRKEDTNSQEQILLKNGWERAMVVANPKSDNDVGLFQRRLNPEKYRSG